MWNSQIQYTNTSFSTSHMNQISITTSFLLNGNIFLLRWASELKSIQIRFPDPNSVKWIELNKNSARWSKKDQFSIEMDSLLVLNYIGKKLSAFGFRSEKFYISSKTIQFANKLLYELAIESFLSFLVEIFVFSLVHFWTSRKLFVANQTSLWDDVKSVWILFTALLCCKAFLANAHSYIPVWDIWW